MSTPFPKPVRLVVLDCDGVLFDSRGANVAFYNAVFERMGLEPMDAELEHYCHFSSSRQLLGRAFDDDPVRVEAAVAIARQLDYGPFYEHMYPVDGLRETLSTLGRDRDGVLPDQLPVDVHDHPVVRPDLDQERRRGRLVDRPGDGLGVGGA